MNGCDQTEAGVAAAINKISVLAENLFCIVVRILATIAITQKKDSACLANEENVIATIVLNPTDISDFAVQSISEITVRRNTVAVNGTI